MKHTFQNFVNIRTSPAYESAVTNDSVSKHEATVFTFDRHSRTAAVLTAKAGELGNLYTSTTRVLHVSHHLTTMLQGA